MSHDDTSEPTFTALIGSYNGADRIGAALDALQSQVTDFSFEVIVVNDGSSDLTGSVANRDGVRVINLDENQGHGHALNVGLEHARGRFIAMLDDDCVPPADWIERLGLTWNLVDDSVTVIGGLVEPYETNTLNRRYVQFRRPLRHQEEAINESASFWTRLKYQLSPPTVDPLPRPVFYTVGANMSLRTSAAREVGGFSEVRGAGEEESIARPLRSRFGPNTVQLFPDIVMYHDFKGELRDTLKRSQHYGRTNGQQWVSQHKLPSVSSLVPGAFIASALFWLVSPLAAVVIFVLSPYVLYRRWFRWRRQGGPWESIFYPYIEAAEDMSSNLGFLRGAWHQIRAKRSSHT